MRTPSPKATSIAVAAATPVAILAAGALVWQSSYAAFSGTTRNSGNDWATGAVALTDDDAGSARFQVASMVPGQTETKCITVTANASVPGVVKGYAVNPVPSAAGLENYVKIGIVSGDGGGFGSCDGFVGDTTVIPSGTSLKTLAGVDSYAAGAGGWNVTAGTQSRTYRITWTFDTTGLTQTQVDQLQGARTGIDLQWELRSN
ncbi:MAG: hypothetical protein AVDCRST_MAG47-1372 [uncultured Nocardioidaceae bacterium]|uniref:Uncharacterized protein n=1 Tax=uncultured Nocardioidaceae bacterium TaxID=253824 RepID=A0A6J4MYS9_9ACTN|nr:MAG: hypothetical protein AVDCRST_MAG47-1372 [uncultured Nocardioidaceae bacterium]